MSDPGARAQIDTEIASIVALISQGCELKSCIDKTVKWLSVAEWREKVKILIKDIAKNYGLKKQAANQTVVWDLSSGARNSQLQNLFQNVHQAQNKELMEWSCAQPRFDWTSDVVAMDSDQGDQTWQYKPKDEQVNKLQAKTAVTILYGLLKELNPATDNTSSWTIDPRKLGAKGLSITPSSKNLSLMDMGQQIAKFNEQMKTMETKHAKEMEKVVNLVQQVLKTVQTTTRPTIQVNGQAHGLRPSGMGPRGAQGGPAPSGGGSPSTVTGNNFLNGQNQGLHPSGAGSQGNNGPTPSGKGNQSSIMASLHDWHQKMNENPGLLNPFSHRTAGNKQHPTKRSRSGEPLGFRPRSQTESAVFPPAGPTQEPQENPWEQPKKNKKKKKNQKDGNWAKKGSFAQALLKNKDTYLIKPKEGETPDYTHCQKYPVSVLLSMDQSTTKETVESWFTEDQEKRSWFQVSDLRVESFHQGDNVSKYRVTMTKIPVGVQAENIQFWNQFQIPTSVSLRRWRGNPGQSMEDYRCERSWCLSNIDNKQDYSEIMKNDLERDCFAMKDYSVRVSPSLPKGKTLKDCETVSYCVSVRGTKGATPVEDSLPTWLKTNYEWIHCRVWKGPPRHPRTRTKPVANSWGSK